MDSEDRPVFVLLDSNVIIALYNQNDALHKRALETFKKLAETKIKLVISNYLLLEIYTILSQRDSKKTALEFGDLIRNEKPFLIQRIDDEMEEQSWQIFTKIKDKDVSFVDSSIIAQVLEGNYRLVTFDQKIIKLQRQFNFSLFRAPLARDPRPTRPYSQNPRQL